MTEKIRTTIYINKIVLEMAQNAAREKAVQTKSQVSTSQFIEDAIRNSVDMVILEGLEKPRSPLITYNQIDSPLKELSSQEELDLIRNAKGSVKKAAIERAKSKIGNEISESDRKVLEVAQELANQKKKSFDVPFSPQPKG